ncbi:MAG: divergent PAP2 family protein [Candidatus Saccharibacteria bacterium]|nr:divergent PAP2 family protein [Candidatus Saccharibacteria bacterium]
MKYLMIVAMAWLVAQGGKHLAHALGRNRRVFGGNPRSALMLSGGMPSAHAASVVALAVAIGWYDGVHSAAFAVAAFYAAVVMYDAMMVRFSSGEQGDMLNKIISSQKLPFKKIKVAHGHTGVEVLVGAIVGAFVAAIVIFTTK